MQHYHRVSLVTDLDEVVMQLSATEAMWLVRPQRTRRYAGQRVVNTVELVDLESLNLAVLQPFETV